MSNLHAHIATAASDCDGPMYRDYTVFLNDEEKAESAQQDGVNSTCGLTARTPFRPNR